MAHDPMMNPLEGGDTGSFQFTDDWTECPLYLQFVEWGEKVTQVSEGIFWDSVSKNRR